MTTPIALPPAYSDRLTTVWSIVEARETLPSLIAIASATEIDNTESIARGMARASHEAGKRTGYLYLGAARRSRTDATLPYSELSLAARQSPRESFDASLETWRASCDVIIVELPALLGCELGAHVARVSQGVIIGLSAGRKVMPADRELATLLTQLGASVIGVVKVSATTQPRNPSPAHNRSLTSRFFPVRQP